MGASTTYCAFKKLAATNICLSLINCFSIPYAAAVCSISVWIIQSNPIIERHKPQSSVPDDMSKFSSIAIRTSNFGPILS